MTTKRAELRSRMTVAATRRAEPDTPQPGKTAVRTKPVRVTLNLPPELFRQVTRWADHAAEAIGEPRISVQDTIRAMIWAGVADASASSPVLEELRRDRT